MSTINVTDGFTLGYFSNLNKQGSGFVLTDTDTNESVDIYRKDSNVLFVFFNELAIEKSE